VVSRLRFAQDDANQIVGTGIIVPALHFRRDFVVGLGQNLGQIDPGGVISQSAERFDVSHRPETGIVQEKVGFGLQVGSKAILRQAQLGSGTLGRRRAETTGR